MDEYSAQRWRIGDWHWILISSCRMEELADRSAERLAPAEVINLVVAWRALLMTLLVRDHPDLLPEVTFSELETMVLVA